MIPAFKNLYAEVEEFDRNIHKKVLQVVQQEEAAVIALNVDDQLFNKGIDGNGNQIVPPYRAKTIKIKREKGQPTDRVTLKDTGAFHKSFFLTFLSDGFSISAKDRKLLKIVGKYTKDLFGLTPDNVGKLSQDIVKDPLIRMFQKAIQR